MEPLRVWHASFGMGTLRVRGVRVHLAFDDGSVIEFAVDEVFKGNPESWARLRANPGRACFGSDAAPLEWQRWITYRARGSTDTLVLRRDGPPPAGTPRPEDTVLRPLSTAHPDAALGAPLTAAEVRAVQEAWGPDLAGAVLALRDARDAALARAERAERELAALRERTERGD